jgi:broad specificity phosphatase PhoE
MSTLVLVRHGQASFGAADYDLLSPLGERQSRRLGERLGREQPRVKAIHCGPRRRHLQTAQFLVAAARETGAAYPDPTVEDELDELPVKEIVLAHGVGPDLLQSLVQAVRSWAAGALKPPGVITPDQFVARIEGVLARHTPSDGETVILVTSGGPIAVPLLRGRAIADIGDALLQGLSLANGSMTLLGRGGDLLACDPVAHLPPDEITQV